MNDNKRIARNAVIIYVRLIIATVVGLLSSRFVLRGLGVSDFGLYNVVGSIVTMMAFINNIMVSSTYRYVAFEQGKGKEGDVNKVFNTSLTIHICIAVVVLFFSLTLGEFYIDNYLNVDPGKLGVARFIFWTSILSCMISMCCVPFTGLLTAMEKFNVMAIVEIMQRIFVLVLSIVLMHYMGDRLRLYGLCIACFNILFSLVYVIFCISKYRAIVKWQFQRDKRLYREMLGFSGWIAFGAASGMAQHQGGSMIVNYFFGTILNAAYGIANTINSLVGQFSRALAQAAAPQITKSYSGNDINRSIDLASYISKYTVFLMLLFVVPICLEIDSILNIWLGKDSVPPYASIMCQLMLINLTMSGMGEGIVNLIQATGKIKWFQIIMSTISLLALPAAWILYNKGAEPYILLVCFIVTGIVNIVLRPILLYKLINFNVRRLLNITYLRVLYVIISIVPLFVIVQQYPVNHVRSFISIPISLLYIMVSMWLLGFNIDERNRIKTIVKNKIHIR